MGSSQRLEFTATGDTVNVASRLEGLTKDLGAHVIISQTTHEEVAGLFEARSLGSVRVRGASCRSTSTRSRAARRAGGREWRSTPRCASRMRR
jgi:class 3 adenylate cyclase